MPSSWIIKTIDILKYSPFRLASCFPTVTPDQLRLDGFEERLHHGIVKQLPLLLMGALKPSLSGVFGIRVNSIAIPYRYDELTLRVADAVRPPYQEYELRDPFSYDH